MADVGYVLLMVGFVVLAVLFTIGTPLPGSYCPARALPIRRKKDSHELGARRR